MPKCTGKMIESQAKRVIGVVQHPFGSSLFKSCYSQASRSFHRARLWWWIGCEAGEAGCWDQEDCAKSVPN